MSELSERDQRILDLAGRPYAFEGKREQDIRDLLDMSATRFWHIVGALLDEPAAQTYAPTTVNRLRRMRDERRFARSARRIGLDASAD